MSPLDVPTEVLVDVRRRLGEHKQKRQEEGDRQLASLAGAGRTADPSTTPEDPSADEVPAKGQANPWSAESLADLASNPPESVGYLLRQLWPADAYGVIGAESKAGKTWMALDVAVSVAAGVPALDGIQVDRPGPVLAFLGEGGRRNAYRRLRAVCSAKGLDPAHVDRLHLIYRAPKLSDDEAASLIAAEVTRAAPVLIVVDPLYLAAPGADGASLYAMATVLERLQHLAEDAGAACVVVHHWNQSGKGDGFGRFSGAGPEEWGRVLWSVAVTERAASTHPGASLVRLAVRVRGGELADLAFALTREVWSDDPDDLGADLHYRIERGEIVAADTAGRKLTAEDRCLAVLTASGEWMTAETVQDADAERAHELPDTSPMKLRTVQDALSRLAKAVKVDRAGMPQTGYSYKARR